MKKVVTGGPNGKNPTRARKMGNTQWRADPYSVAEERPNLQLWVTCRPYSLREILIPRILSPEQRKNSTGVVLGMTHNECEPPHPRALAMCNRPRHAGASMVQVTGQTFRRQCRPHQQ